MGVGAWEWSPELSGMNKKCYVFLSAEGQGFPVDAAFARVPAPGDHVFLYLSKGQRAAFGPDYHSEPATPCIVRDTVLRPQEEGVSDYVADVFVSPIRADDWQYKMAAYGRGEDPEPPG